MNKDSVVLVLSEFVRSDYARTTCNYCNVQPTDYGQIGGMFECVVVADHKIEVKMQQAFSDAKSHLLDRLSMYFRARICNFSEMHALHRDGRDIY